jgi:hypothetical protein
MTFRAVPLSPGEHHVVFRFVPVGFTLGVCASAVTLLLMALACSAGSVTSRGVGSDPESPCPADKHD